MGRVHKKKIAEYAENAENEKEYQDEIKKGAVVESRSCSDEEGEGDDKEKGKVKKQSGVKTAKPAEDTDEDLQSIQGEDNQTEENNGQRKGNKRKSVPEKITADDIDEEDSDDEPLNGSGISSAKKGRKQGAKAKAPAGGKNGKAGGGGRAKGKKPQTKETDTVEEEYEVKEVVGYKKEDGVNFYLIRWKGYTKDDDTWEPEDTLSCPGLIEKYNAKQEAGPKSEKKLGSPGKRGRPSGKQEVFGADPNKEWEVDKIVDYAEEKNQRVFRIRWKGFGPKHDTWEPEKNLSCDEIISKFMKRMKEQENVTFKELREEPKKTKRLVNETVPRDNYTPRERKSKRSGSKKRVYYGDSDE